MIDVLPFQIYFNPVTADGLEEECFKIIKYEKFELMDHSGLYLVYQGNRYVRLKHHLDDKMGPEKTLFRLHGKCR